MSNSFTSKLHEFREGCKQQSELEDGALHMRFKDNVHVLFVVNKEDTTRIYEGLVGADDEEELVVSRRDDDVIVVAFGNSIITADAERRNE